jgi:hypothetical protein
MMTWIKGEKKRKRNKQTKKKDIICVLYNKKHFRLCTKITVGGRLFLLILLCNGAVYHFICFLMFLWLLL